MLRTHHLRSTTAAVALAVRPDLQRTRSRSDRASAAGGGRWARAINSRKHSPMDLAVNEPARKYVIGAWVIAALLLWLTLRFDLLPALLAGLLVFELVHVITPRLAFVRERRARVLAVAFIATVVVGALSVAIFGAVLFFRSETGGYVLLLKKSAEVIQTWRDHLPPWLVHTLPRDADGLQGSVAAWLKEHLTTVQSFGREGATHLARVLIA